jgi:hypothetical protein
LLCRRVENPSYYVFPLFVYGLFFYFFACLIRIKIKPTLFVQGRFHYLLPTVKVTTLRAAVPRSLLLLRYLICLLAYAFSPCYEHKLQSCNSIDQIIGDSLLHIAGYLLSVFSNWYYSRGLKLAFQDQLN